MATADTQSHKPSSRRRRNQGHRSENDFVPNNITNDSPPSTPAPPPPVSGSSFPVSRSSVIKRPTKQLDFHQAMSDFKCMFPTMENDVIEAVLRANDGAVDATIDQLLTMTIDCDGRDSPDDLDVEAISQLAEDCPNYEDSKTDSPPSYTEAVRAQQNSSIWTTPISSHKLPTVTGHKNQNRSPSSSLSKKTAKRSSGTHLIDIDELSLSNTEPKRPLSMSLTSDLTQNTPLKRAYKNWNPPMLGTLPDDFLRLTVTPVKSSPSNLSSNSTPSRMSSSSLTSRSFDDSGIMLDKTPKSHSKSERHASSRSSGERKKISRSLTEHSSGEKHKLLRSNTDRAPGFLGSPSSHGSGSGMGNRMPGFLGSPSSHGTGSGMAKSLVISQHEFSRDMLDEKMKENERQRKRAVKNVDPEMSQYLEDERLAIMLQNSEFLQELRGNEDFMKTLERDRMNMSAFEPIRPPKPSKQEEVVQPLSPDEGVSEGYGEDRQDHLDAFPFSQPAPSKKDDDAELRRQLKNMGGASRKQFAALAKKFFSRRKKKMTLKQIQKEKLAPSMVNLLDSDEEDFNPDVHLNNDSYNQHTTIDPLPLPIQSVPSHRTFQRPIYHPDGIVTYHDNRASDMV